MFVIAAFSVESQYLRKGGQWAISEGRCVYGPDVVQSC